MQWSADKNAGFSTADQTYLPVIDDENYGFQRLNVAAQERDDESYLAWTRYLINTRQGQPAFGPGTLDWVETGDKAVLAYRRTEGDNRVLCVFNLTDEARPSGITLETDVHDLLDRDGRVYPAGVEIPLDPYEALWLLQSV